MNKPVSVVIAGVVGGLVVGLIFLTLILSGALNSTKTIVQKSSSPIIAARGNVGSKGINAGEIYKRDAPGVVNIKATIVQRSSSPFDFGSPQRDQATGSGFVADKSGHIITNAHVVDGATKVRVGFGDKKTVDATVVGTDTSTDLAVLKVDPSSVKLVPLPLGNSKDVAVGDPTVAIGNPFGLSQTLTTGVVSALQRHIEAPNGFKINNVIQTDAAINPGNSGGPLIDERGEVIGINSQIVTGGSGSGNVGIGFAIPINTAKEIIPQLEKNGKIERAFLGLSGMTIDKSLSRLNLQAKSGVLVQEVVSNGPAEKAGIKGGDSGLEATVDGSPILLGGDIIEKIDGAAIKSMDQVVNLVEHKKPNQKIKVELLREGKPKTVVVTLSKRPLQQSPTLGG